MIINFTLQNFYESQYLQNNSRSAILIIITISDLIENTLNILNEQFKK